MTTGQDIRPLTELRDALIEKMEAVRDLKIAEAHVMVPLDSEEALTINMGIVTTETKHNLCLIPTSSVNEMMDYHKFTHGVEMRDIVRLFYNEFYNTHKGCDVKTSNNGVYWFVCDSYFAIVMYEEYNLAVHDINKGNVE